MSVDSAGERGRFEALCMPFRADVFRFVYWLCRDRALAEDVVQETLLRAWRSLDSLGDEAAARPWLLTIARRELARVFERKRLPMVDIDVANESEPEALAVDDRHEVAEMRRAILKLDVIHREPLVLQVLLGYSTEEIAKHLEISVAAVLTRLFRARQVLRQQLVGAEGARS
ncbi:MAG TPA: sigma-70 family RNA polymerase sigma factor [Steroidobacter sp.]|uniref:sigma-70 family RNA polymerase sigma factor n=1 Tax=Steroidobacter sp. TaxID=1978227 RepID=UPI002ED92DD3